MKRLRVAKQLKPKWLRNAMCIMLAVQTQLSREATRYGIRNAIDDIAVAQQASC